MQIRGYIEREKEIFETPVTIAEGLEFDFPRTLRKTELYYNSKFMGGERDSDGFKKIFFNINKRPVKTSQKSVDIDTKDIQVQAEEGGSDIQAWFLEKELLQFMKEENFGEFLNDVVERYPKYGEVVVKNVKGKPKVVSLHNLRYDPQLHIEDSPWVHEEHLYTIEEFQNTAEELGWDKDAVEEVLALYKSNDIATIGVIERYGYYEERDLVDGGGDTLSPGVVICAGFDRELQKKKKEVPTIILHKQELDVFPYRSLSWESIDHRGIGVGVVEENFEAQEFYNDVNNKERKALEWNTRKLFRSSDPNVPKNLFRTKRNGDVIESRDFTEIPMAERNLAQFNALYQRIINNSDGTSFTFEVNTGESLPSGTPFRLGAILSNATDSYFNFKREKLGLFITGIIEDFIIPEFKKKKRKGHIFSFTAEADEMNKFDLLMTNAILKKEMDKFVKKNGVYPLPQHVEAERMKIMEKLRQRDERFPELPDKFYDNIKTKIKIVITGENSNTATDLTTLTSLYTVLSEQQDPRAEKVLNQILSLAGTNPIGLLGLSTGMAMGGGTQQLQVVAPVGQE